MPSPKLNLKIPPLAFLQSITPLTTFDDLLDVVVNEALDGVNKNEAAHEKAQSASFDKARASMPTPNECEAREQRDTMAMYRQMAMDVTMQPTKRAACWRLRRQTAAADVL